MYDRTIRFAEEGTTRRATSRANGRAEEIHPGRASTSRTPSAATGESTETTSATTTANATEHIERTSTTADDE